MTEELAMKPGASAPRQAQSAGRSVYFLYVLETLVRPLVTVMVPF